MPTATIRMSPSTATDVQSREVRYTPTINGSIGTPVSTTVPANAETHSFDVVRDGVYSVEYRDHDGSNNTSEWSSPPLTFTATDNIAPPAPPTPTLESIEGF